MGDYKGGHATSGWERFWNSSEYEKHNALRAGDQESIDAYNNSTAGKDNPITQEDQDNWAEYGSENTPTGLSGNAVKLSQYEIELSKRREAERAAAQKKAEELLANQPDYTIPESVQGYVNIMTDIGNLLGGITDASGGGSPSYTVKPYTVKNSPGYGDKPVGSPSTEQSFRNNMGVNSEFSNFLSSVRPTQKQTY